MSKARAAWFTMKLRIVSWPGENAGHDEAGKIADLVLRGGNPLEDIRNTQRINAVVSNGRLFDRKALDKLLADAEGAAKR